MELFEELKSMLKDDSLHVAIGTISKLILADDRSCLKVLVNIFPEGRENVARMSWDTVGPEAGNFTFPSVGDLVLLAIAEGNDDQLFVIKRLTSKEDKIPINATDGSTVIKALDGKNLWLTSSRINISKGDAIPEENIVLGQIFKTFADSLLTEIAKIADENSKEMHIGNLGYNTSVPINSATYTLVKTAINNLKNSPINDDKILSETSYTEK